MWFRLRPDIRYPDLAYGMWRSLIPGGRTRIEADLGRLWAGSEHTLVCLSVRTGFDLLLEALALPPGSEVVMTALTIPDMVTIVQRHQLVPVALDIASRTLGPDLEDLRRCLTPKTRAVVITHLFGARVPVEPVLRLLAGKPILLFEDCAQAFAGGQGYTGHPEADAAMFSFGPIKTSTALGGALFRIKDPALLKRLKALEQQLPRSERRKFLRRLGKYFLLKLATNPVLWGLIARFCLKRDIHYDATLTRLARGFGGPQDLLVKIRRQPPVPLLALLRRRLKHFDADDLRRRRSNGERLARLISPAMALAGMDAPQMSYWLFPLQSEKRSEIIPRLRQQGFDASQNHTLGVVPWAGQIPGSGNRQAQKLLNELLLAPAGAALPEKEISRLAECLLQAI